MSYVFVTNMSFRIIGLARGSGPLDFESRDRVPYPEALPFFKIYVSLYF